MNMTRQHFEFIATTLRELRRARRGFHADAHRMVAEEFAARLRETNPGFNRERFLRACGIKEEA